MAAWTYRRTDNSASITKQLRAHVLWVLFRCSMKSVRRPAGVGRISSGDSKCKRPNVPEPDVFHGCCAESQVTIQKLLWWWHQLTWINCLAPMASNRRNIIQYRRRPLRARRLAQSTKCFALPPTSTDEAGTEMRHKGQQTSRQNALVASGTVSSPASPEQ